MVVHQFTNFLGVRMLNDESEISRAHMDPSPEGLDMQPQNLYC